MAEVVCLPGAPLLVKGQSSVSVAVVPPTTTGKEFLEQVIPKRYVHQAGSG
jgi:hypothetical protein